MKVKQLKKLLENAPDDAKIYLSDGVWRSFLASQAFIKGDKVEITSKKLKSHIDKYSME